MRKKKETRYSLARLIEYCNQTFETKANGKSFDGNDVVGYIKRGSFPKKLGGKKIITCSEKELREAGIEVTIPMYRLED